MPGDLHRKTCHRYDDAPWVPPGVGVRSVACYTILGIMHSAGADMKPLVWVGSSRKNLKAFPKEVRYVFGQALFEAQLGRKHPGAKPLKGLNGGTVLEVVEDHAGNTYRVVYTVKFDDPAKSRSRSPLRAAAHKTEINSLCISPGLGGEIRIPSPRLAPS